MRHATQIPSSKFQVPTIDIVSLQSANPDSVSLMPTAQLVESISGDPGAVVPVLVQQSATPPPLPSLAPPFLALHLCPGARSSGSRGRALRSTGTHWVWSLDDSLWLLLPLLLQLLLLLHFLTDRQTD
ncbi:hypothetical protein KC19_3G008500 [Ceratodon purpureus]|uniref:Uncharacterized protein n=1 Tax=Ceratodon purpureus TaxID=3225 RepID=A0A8T0IDH1_CERPU|nr:hypothetical protein KC19_3G008500 [Ceratodon purpureus]